MREFKKEYGDQIEDARKKWNRSILCIEPIAELTGKCVVSGWLDSPENVYLRLTVRALKARDPYLLHEFLIDASFGDIRK